MAGGISSNANAQQGVGLCNGILAQSRAPANQINQGINVIENCDKILATILGEFVSAGCGELPEGSLSLEKSSGALERWCQATVDTCGITNDFCE